ncbi:nitroreductase/quinone reductase family protein [Smaragdicoccus niigatensis]|uniref:nitroreductase/quinone reductase family protein n=1 Tax=Smaragdicoccus niigatensis TaxID=359359 RepID=UPI0003781163|nr:nitroreductase/quinone reductase family protein [Smaragdicoccus niigatensis]
MNPIAKKLMATANKAASGLYRTTNGKVGGSVRGQKVLILTVPGRKSGQPRSVPLAYFEHGGNYLVVGSAGGMKDEPDWMKNLAAVSTASVQIGDSTTAVAVRIAAEPERALLWHDVVLARAPFFADYQRKTDRTLRIGVLTPQ